MIKKNKNILIAMFLLIALVGWFAFNNYQKQIAKEKLDADVAEAKAKADAEPRWVFIDENESSKNKIFIYLPILKDVQNPSILTTWTKLIAVDGSYTTAQQSFDCIKRESKNNFFRLYDTKGNVTNSFEGENKWKPITPDTFGDEILIKICN